jgi:hypothetical protein
MRQQGGATAASCGSASPGPRQRVPSATYVALLVRGHLHSIPPIPEAELLAVKQSISELRSIGRGLNAMAGIMGSNWCNFVWAETGNRGSATFEDRPVRPVQSAAYPREVRA